MTRAWARRFSAVCAVLAAVLLATDGARAATEFAHPDFRAPYVAGESITPNFWGPLRLASDGYRQDYNGRDRTVQYFDKARMEWQSGRGVTFGLLATEMVTGRIQLGDNEFLNKTPRDIPVAGDEDGEGATYLDIFQNRNLVLGATPQRTGEEFSLLFVEGQFVTDRRNTTNLRTLRLTDYDSTTRHNVIQVFRQYRDRVGFSTIGYAISEPFASYFTVGGVETPVVVQVFERRILTFTPDNPPAFQVEMGNIGRHYFFWRDRDR